MLTSAATPPTEISMLPVTITIVRPHDAMSSAAFAFSMLKNVCGFRKPEPWNTIAQTYISINTPIVIMSSRFVSDIDLMRRRLPPAGFFSVIAMLTNLLFL